MSDWPAPAKLNRFLHILGRREDGYHELQTLFQFIDLADRLTFSPAPAGRVQRTGWVCEADDAGDLAWRAARALQRATGCRRGVSIHLEKLVPVGGGLGGGSSDAATVLVALNALWETGLGEDRLAALGAELGADVPVFVRGHAAWAEGRGERLTPVAPDTPWFLLIDPGVSVSTAAIFNAPELTRNTPRMTIRALDRRGWRNDCAASVRSRYPAVGEALDWLGESGTATLTGTGSCVFAPMPDAESARRLAREVPRPWRAWAVAGRNRSPLLKRLRDFRHQ